MSTTNTSAATSHPTSTSLVSRFPLRGVLRFDAAFSGLSGVAMLAFASVLAEPFGETVGFLRGVGAFLIVFAAGVALVAAPPRTNCALALTIVVGNVIWVAASFVHLATAWTPLTNLGAAMVVVQALGVATLAELEWSGVKRA